MRVNHSDSFRQDIMKSSTVKPVTPCAPDMGIMDFELCSIERAVGPLAPRTTGSCIEILYLQQGIQIFTINGRDTVLNGGDILIVPTGCVYSSGHHPQYKSRYHRLRISTHSPCLLGLDRRFNARLSDYLSSLRDVHYYGNDRLSGLIESAFSNLTADDSASKCQGYGELISFFTALPRHMKNRALQRTPDIEIAYRYINRHITEDISLQSLARLSNCSLSYFKERFTSQVGVTPMYYINWRKIAYAKRLISQNYSVTEVASILSFTTPAYFSTVFKNYTSRTPMQYRQIIDLELRKQQHILPGWNDSSEHKPPPL